MRSTVLDVIESMAPRRITPRALLGVYVAWFYGMFAAAVAFVVAVTWLLGSPLYAPPLVVALFVTIGVVASRRRNAPRRWLAQGALRVDGYLELVGREEHVERLLLRVDFARGAPGAQLVRDVLSGAGCDSAGVESTEDGAVTVLGPALRGDQGALHAWVQGLIDRGLTPLHDDHPIALVTVEER